MTEPYILVPAPPAADLTTCDREPIHTPGSIQPHGAMIVLDARDLRVTHISANLPTRLLGRPAPEALDNSIVLAAQTALHEDGHSLSRIHAAPRTPELPYSEMVVHHLDGRIYAEFETPVSDHDEAGAVAGVQAIIQALRRTRSRQELCDVAVRELKSLTGFDRVMAYRFDPAGNGEVIAEACEPELEPFRGLHFPASDIPKQARQLYLRQRVRTIADVGYTPVPILTEAIRPGHAEVAALDMSLCHLRGLSPLHIEYLQNMGVGATLAISLIPDDALWGMLICHHRTPRRVSARVRALCDLIGQLMSFLIGEKGQNERLAERVVRARILDAIGERVNAAAAMPVQALLERPEEVLELLEADGALVQIGNQTQLFGRTPTLPQALTIAATMRARHGGEAAATNALGTIAPELGPLSGVAGGALVLPILHGPDDFIVWFRDQVAQTVTWGGNPEKPVESEAGRLTPRKSFAAWQSVVQGQCQPWKEVDLELAKDLRRLVTTAMLRNLETQTKLAGLRHYDALTGLPNRRLLEERLAARRADKDASPATMIFLDLDRFKTVNDSLGHAAGDDLLVQVANRLVESVASHHLVARIGGDEFVVLCENAPLAAGQEIAEAVIAAFRAPFQLAGRPYRLSTSVGVAQAGLGQPDHMLRSADSAMYAAKREGGNRAVTFDSSLHEAALQKLEIEQDLHQALERGEFEAHYQPLAALPSGEIVGFEALLRWRHPERGLVSPADFVPLAEETGLISPIGAQVLRQALCQVRAWREISGRGLFVSVNVSACQAARPDFPAEIAAALAEAGLPGEALLLEVTESIVAQSVAIGHLEAVRRTGVRIAIDDFGTGYSSLAYLQTLPVDELKIDKMFVSQLGRDTRSSTVTQALIQLAHALSLTVIAEGVEDERQWAELRSLGCDAAQGYWISRPVPVAQALALCGWRVRSDEGEDEAAQVSVKRRLPHSEPTPVSAAEMA
ncbi:bifunctional diguanylate cyclase/phosphodiesterase [Muricoccus nepalensis]|uniref:bifunctional diguanylate cyclase/phosphodiesterase n=1 Tax=Muricoccus nepalensis TaxID=1854500 RepID=UPI00112DD490|nr:EAL domain-containing protein [Roseomonas nepalensis]